MLLRAMVQTFLDNSLCIAEDPAEGKFLALYGRDGRVVGALGVSHDDRQRGE